MEQRKVKSALCKQKLGPAQELGAARSFMKKPGEWLVGQGQSLVLGEILDEESWVKDSPGKSDTSEGIWSLMPLQVLWKLNVPCTVGVTGRQDSWRSSWVLRALNLLPDLTLIASGTCTQHNFISGLRAGKVLAGILIKTPEKSDQFDFNLKWR